MKMRRLDDWRFWGWLLLGLLGALQIALLLLGTGLGHAYDLIPDPDVTPGVMRELSLHKICTTKWGLDRRLVTAKMKRQVFENYGLKPTDRSCHLGKHKSRFEVDHLIPRCAGGADVVANLWPECYSGKWNATQKDRLEVRICKDICEGELSPEDVPALVMPDWRKGYRHYFGK